MTPDQIQALLKEVSKISDNSIEMMELLSAALVAVAQITAKKSHSAEECAKGLALIVYEKMLLAQTIAGLMEQGVDEKEIQAAIDKTITKIDNNEIPEWLR